MKLSLGEIGGLGGSVACMSYQGPGSAAEVRTVDVQGIAC